jgi:VanZ family protein
MTKQETMRRFWLGVGYAGWIIIVTLSLLPTAARPHTGLGGQYEHWLAYAVVGFALGMGYRRLSQWLLSALTLSLSSGVLELLQNFVPGRNPELLGFLTSSLGAWCGLLVAIYALGFFQAGASD